MRRSANGIDELQPGSVADQPGLQSDFAAAAGKRPNGIRGLARTTPTITSRRRICWTAPRSAAGPEQFHQSPAQRRQCTRRLLVRPLYVLPDAGPTGLGFLAGRRQAEPELRQCGGELQAGQWGAVAGQHRHRRRRGNKFSARGGLWTSSPRRRTRCCASTPATGLG